MKAIAKAKVCMAGRSKLFNGGRYVDGQPLLPAAIQVEMMLCTLTM
jgi:hypothetical protein